MGTANFLGPSYVWADGTKGGYMIYYSLLNPAEDQYDRVFYSYADATFTRLTKPRLLVDWGYATIDADINYVPADGLYHMLIKKEGGTPGIFAATATKLTGPYKIKDENDYVKFEGNKKCEAALPSSWWATLPGAWPTSNTPPSPKDIASARPMKNSPTSTPPSPWRA